MTDEAQAVAAVATTSGKVVDALSDVGRYVAGVLGTLPHDVVGLLGADKLKHRRERNLARLVEETRKITEDIAKERLSEPSPSVLIPLMSAAVDEERDELRSLWAKLLANAAIDGGKKVRREFFETVRQMEPTDAAILQTFSRNRDEKEGKITWSDVESQINKIDNRIDSIDVSVSMKTLDRLGCITLFRENEFTYVEDEFTDYYVLSSYGAALCRALIIEE